MKKLYPRIKKTLLAIFILVASFNLQAQTCSFATLDVTGYNADVIAEGTGGEATDKTTTSVDAFYAFYSQDFVPLTPHSSGTSAAAYGGGFPTDGLLSNTAVSGLSFQLADFSSNNALVLRNSLTNQGTLTLATPMKAQTIYIAAVRGEGGSTSADNHDVTTTVHFSDGSSEVLVFQATAWWFDSGAPSNTAIANTGEVSQNTATSGWAPRNEFRGLSNTNLFYNELALSPSNYSKNIVSIDFDKAVTANNAHTTAILGVSICEAPTYDPVTSVVVATAGSVAAEITQNQGTLQLEKASVNPSSSLQDVTWSIVSGGAYASVDSNGLVSALGNGVVTVRATSSQDTNMYDELDVTITNQIAYSACAFTALDVTGYNEDVIAEGTGGEATDKTTTSVDAFYAFYSQDFVPSTPHSSGVSATAYGGGFPTDGLLSNTAVSGLSFQLADFSANNALVLRNNITNQGTLTLTTPKKAQTIYVAAVRGEGGSSSADNHYVTATVNFSDGTSEVFVFQATAWWFDSGAPTNIAMANTGEVSQNTASSGWAPRNEFRGLSNTNLFYNELALSVSNYSKNILSIDFDKAVTADDARTTAILGVSICESNYSSTVSGFNYDIIANGIGDAAASSDLGLDEVNSRALVSLDFQATSGSSFPTYGLPADGVVASVATSGVSYQLADYSGANALYLTPSYVTGSINTQNSGTLSFTADNVGNIYILSAAAGGGSSNLPYTAVVHFSDGSTQTADLQAKDWYNNSGFAIQGIGRVNRANNNLEGDSSNPRLYEDVISLYTSNQTKTITGITFTFAGDASAEWANEIRLAILAVTTTQSTLSAENFSIEVEADITLYPNPSHGLINIKSNLDLESVQVFNAIGQQVLMTKGQNQIDLSNVQAGIYIVRVQTKEGKTSIYKIVKK